MAGFGGLSIGEIRLTIKKVFEVFWVLLDSWALVSASLLPPPLGASPGDPFGGEDPTTTGV